MSDQHLEAVRRLIRGLTVEARQPVAELRAELESEGMDVGAYWSEIGATMESLRGRGFPNLTVPSSGPVRAAADKSGPRPRTSKRLGKFELPGKLTKVEESATPTYAKFIAEPFEAGYGQTVGNSLRRVLLSSIEGAAVSGFKLKGVNHEFQSIDGVVEDVSDIVLNLKKVLVVSHTRETVWLHLTADKTGAITAADIQTGSDMQIINPDQLICTLGQKKSFDATIEVRTGRGYYPGEANKKANQPPGFIPIDALFSPVRLVRYSVDATRVGQITDYDRLSIEIWTDGRITPDGALKQAASILKHHLEVFDCVSDESYEFENQQSEVSEEQNKLRKLLNMSVNEIELSVRAANCLNNANITTVGELAMKSEQEMLKYRNFGRKSLNEIKEKLDSLGLSLGMKFDERLLEMRREA